MARTDFTGYMPAGARTDSVVITQGPLARALNTEFIRRVSRVLDAQMKAGSIVSYSWSLPRVEAMSAAFKLTIETSAGSITGSLHVFAEGTGYSSPGYMTLTGRTDALLLTSLFDKAWFPGEPGKSKTRGGARDAELLGDRRDVEIRYARVKGNNVFVDLTVDEGRDLIVAMWGESIEQRKARIRQGEVNRRVQDEVAKLPNSKAQFRSQVLEHLSWNIKLVRHVLSEAQGGYAFRPSDLDDCWVALNDLDDAMRSAGVVFDVASREIEIAKIIDRQIA